MEFEGDEQKRLANLAKHGLDFDDVEAMFEGKLVFQGSRALSAELRELAFSEKGKEQ